uniref:NACHT, LRR and PYD domains-containing protein 1b allele 5-like n=1 Tax=Oryzias melastigma TaxID=30732 RepID=A0A3B3BEZ5_ORYME
FPGQTVDSALKKCLQKLSSKEFKEFTDSLLDREGEPRVYKNQIEGKDYMEVTNVMVNVFSEKNVLSVAAEVLRDANLEGLADELGESLSLSLNPTSDGARPSLMGHDQFVDKYRAELAKKLTDTNPLLDLLCSKKVLNDNSYAEIKALPTDNQRMSKLLFGSYVKSAPTCSILFNYLKDEKNKQKH